MYQRSHSVTLVRVCPDGSARFWVTPGTGSMTTRLLSHTGVKVTRAETCGLAVSSSSFPAIMDQLLVKRNQDRDTDQCRLGDEPVEGKHRRVCYWKQVLSLPVKPRQTCRTGPRRVATDRDTCRVCVKTGRTGDIGTFSSGGMFHSSQSSTEAGSMNCCVSFWRQTTEDGKQAVG